MHIIFVV